MKQQTDNKSLSFKEVIGPIILIIIVLLTGFCVGGLIFRKAGDDVIEELSDELSEANQQLQAENQAIQEKTNMLSSGKIGLIYGRFSFSPYGIPTSVELNTSSKYKSFEYTETSIKNSNVTYYFHQYCADNCEKLSTINVFAGSFAKGYLKGISDTVFQKKMWESSVKYDEVNNEMFNITVYRNKNQANDLYIIAEPANCNMISESSNGFFIQYHFTETNSDVKKSNEDVPEAIQEIEDFINNNISKLSCNP